jgi:hypothetical protein
MHEASCDYSSPSTSIEHLQAVTHTRLRPRQLDSNKSNSATVQYRRAACALLVVSLYPVRTHQEDVWISRCRRCQHLLMDHVRCFLLCSTIMSFKGCHHDGFSCFHSFVPYPSGRVGMHDKSTAQLSWYRQRTWHACKFNLNCTERVARAGTIVYHKKQ